MKKHEKGMIFTCYFHPTNVVTDGAVLNLTIHWSLAVHVTLWPSLAILSGVLLCVYTYFWKKHVRRKNKTDYGTVPSHSYCLGCFDLYASHSLNTISIEH